MNDWSANYCSGGESGWTMYLDQSYTSEHHYTGAGGGVGENYRKKEAKARVEEEEEEEEEDLSMVSDASSGPPHYIEDNGESFYNNGYSSYAFSASESAVKCKEEEKKKKGKQHGRNQQHSYLDDTASSPVYGHGKASKINAASSNEALEENAVDFSQGFSATHFKKKSSLRKHLSFYRSGKSAPEE